MVVDDSSGKVEEANSMKAFMSAVHSACSFSLTVVMLAIVRKLAVFTKGQRVVDSYGGIERPRELGWFFLYTSAMLLSFLSIATPLVIRCPAVLILFLPAVDPLLR